MTDGGCEPQDVPPYDPLPTTPYNVTTGRTYYYVNEGASRCRATLQG